MKKNNPFALTFGLKPNNYIERLTLSEEIISSFDNNTNNVFMITGMRGTGKTVMLSHISSTLSEQDNWIVLDIIPSMDMLDQFASRLYDISLMHRIFNGKEFGFSFSGISFSIKGDKPVTNVLSLIEILVRKADAKGKKILVCVDEAVNNEYMRTFVQAFQILTRNKLPVYLLMTGLYNNIYDLQNDKSITFLLRAPKIELGPLNIGAIAHSYMQTLTVDYDQAKNLALITKGYAYAYQVLGYLMFENDKKEVDDDILFKLDQYLYEYVYEKVWSELSSNDRKIMLAFNDSETQTTEELTNGSGIGQSSFGTYRLRLMRKGLLSSPMHGSLSIVLPRFNEFMKTV